MEDQSGNPISRRGIYLLPNLLTTAAIFSGFYSIIASMKGHFDIAAMTIFIAMIADGLDGRVARLMNAQTAFGAQYDSLSDMIAFGLAPALLVYAWSIQALGKMGWFIAFVFAVSTALRLARFNVQQSDNKLYFQGLPSPSAAAIVASLVWVFSGAEQDGQFYAFFMATITIMTASLMVSNIRYFSFKSVHVEGKVSFFKVVLIIFLLTAVMMRPPEMLFVVFFIYAASGPFLTIAKLRRVKAARKLRGKRS